MAREEKPYRMYRGGRVKGKVPTTVRRPQSARGGNGAGGADGTPYRGPGARPDRRRRHLGRWIVLGLFLLVTLIVVWGVFGYLSVASGVADANKRLDPDAKAALTKQNGLLVSHPTIVLMLGTDNADVTGRTTDNHSDSIMLLRTDPSHHRLYYL